MVTVTIGILYADGHKSNREISGTWPEIAATVRRLKAKAGIIDVWYVE
jgi:hypothetical protein